MASDFRVPLDPIFEAFGVPATVTRPVPDDIPIQTTAIWDTGATDTIGVDLKRRESRLVMGLRRDQVPTVPKGTLIEAPPMGGGAVQTWRVDGTDRVMDDLTHVLVVAEPTL